MTIAETLTAADRPVHHDDARNLVLVHGVVMDGSSWRPVYNRLVRNDFEVRIAQLPLTSLAANVAATHRLIEQLDGPTVLVGHSYGGMVITAAGTHDRVQALIYVAGFQPDVDESVANLGPSISCQVIHSC